MSTRGSLEDAFVGAVTIGERGQVVIPADARKKLDLHTGDRLMIMTHPEKQGLMMVKIDAMREFLHHMAQNLLVAEAGELAEPEESDEPGAKNPVE